MHSEFSFYRRKNKAYSGIDNDDKNKYGVIHHKNYNKLDNSPENLEWMGNVDHTTLHRDIIVRYNKSEKKRLKTIEDNKKYKKAQKMGAEYNGSDLHKTHNEIRKKAQLESWKNNRKGRSKAMQWNIPDECVELGKQIYRNNPKLNRESFIEMFKKNQDIRSLIEQHNTKLNRSIDKLSRTAIERKLNSFGYSGFVDFKKDAIGSVDRKNHKVAVVEFVDEVADVYCMTVVGPNGEDDRHNFGACSINESNIKCDSSIIIKNSTDEDYFIPIRGEHSSHIDTLPGGQFTGDIEDLKYIQNKLFAALKIPKSYLGYEEDINAKCLHPDTLIPLLDGSQKTIKQVADKVSNGEKVFVYSVDETNNNVVAGEVLWGGKTRKNAELVEVVLDNDEVVKCTLDHKFMLRDGSYKQAQFLQTDDSLMPFYTKISSKKDGDGILNGYEKVYDPAKNKYVYTHQMVCKTTESFLKGKVIHHVDFNKRNNHPENLDCSMTYLEHRKYHQENIKKTMNSPEAIARRVNDPKWLKCVSEGGKKGCKALERWRNSVEKIVPWNKGLTIESSEKVLNNAKALRKYKNISVCLREGCDKTFRQTYSRNSSTKRKKFCSRSCSNSYNMRAKRKREHNLFWVEKKCLTCNKNFETRRKKDSKFCSVVCRRSFGGHKVLVKNHKVKDVRFLTERVDCYDLTMKDNPNFAVSAGIYLHNSTLSQQDVRFSRTIQRVQKVFVAELNKLAVIHLWSMGFSDEDLSNFEISMANPSSISELQRLELLRTKFEVSAMVPQNGIFDKQTVYEKIWQLPPEDVEAIEEGRRKDQLVDLEIMQMQPPQPMGAPPAPAPGAPPGMAPPMAPPMPGAPPPPQPIMASKDPNIQSAAPNELTKIKKPKKEKSVPDLKKFVFNTKKTAMDPKRTQSELGRMVKAPFGEGVDENEHFERRAAFVKNIAKELQEVEVLRKAREKKTKKVLL